MCSRTGAESVSLTGTTRDSVLLCAGPAGSGAASWDQLEQQRGDSAGGSDGKQKAGRPVRVAGQCCLPVLRRCTRRTIRIVPAAPTAVAPVARSNCVGPERSAVSASIVWSAPPRAAPDGVMSTAPAVADVVLVLVLVLVLGAVAPGLGTVSGTSPVAATDADGEAVADREAVAATDEPFDGATEGPGVGVPDVDALGASALPSAPTRLKPGIRCPIGRRGRSSLK